MESILKRKNISETPFRKSVLGIINSSDSAVSVSQIENGLGDFNRVTLYRTIKTFLERGIIHSISIAGEDLRYAMCEATCQRDNHIHNHLHLQCSQCNSVYCVDLPANSFINKSNHLIESFEVHAKGVCVACQ
jgi:Fur family transcriptional regulator, ferric uptake regulator